VPDETDLDRFVEAQRDTFDSARAEIAAGRKQTHWMWFIYPQLRGLGQSQRAWFYGIANLEEAARYLDHPILGPRLHEMMALLLPHRDRSAKELFGAVDAQKLCSSVTLFRAVPGADPIFDNVLSAFCAGPCTQTEARILGFCPSGTGSLPAPWRPA